MNKNLLSACVLVALGSSACSFAARSPEMYRDDTQKLLATKSEALKACYDGVLKGDPKAQGSVVVTFEVTEETGEIVNAAVKDDATTAPAPVRDCVVQSLQGLTLAPGDARKGLATFSYDFEIAPQKAAAPAPAAPKS